MNRTLLLILCDFLLLTLLALTKWETAEPERPVTQTVEIEAGDGAVTAADDIVALMQLSFDEQAEAQSALAAEKAQLAEEKAAEAARLEAALEQRRRALRVAAAEISQRDQSLAELVQERQSLTQNLATTQQQAVELNRQLSDAAGEAAASRARLEQLQRDLEAREAEVVQRAAEVARLAEEKAIAQAQIENLNVAVRVAEQEKVLLRETADTYREQAEVERQERMKAQEATVQLAEGVGELAEKSAEITAEIRDNRPINANTLFSEFLINRVPARFAIERPGLFGGMTEREASPRTVLVTDGIVTYAVMHVEDTPFNLVEPPTDWSRIEIELSKNGATYAAPSMHFLQRDPRVVVVPIDAERVGPMGVKVYAIANDPFRFPEAVLINNGGQGYGEVPFKLEVGLPGYVRMDSGMMRRLVGDFPPSRGDLVLSKTGHLLGVMVTTDLCVLLDDFSVQATFLTGDTSSQSESAVLQQMRTGFERRTTAGPRGGR